MKVGVHESECIAHVQNTAFAQFAPSKSNAKALTTLPLQKIAYLLCNLLTLAVGLWKCRSMGLLPTGTGDWLAFEMRGQASLNSSFLYWLKTTTASGDIVIIVDFCKSIRRLCSYSDHGPYVSTYCNLSVHFAASSSFHLVWIECQYA